MVFAASVDWRVRILAGPPSTPRSWQLCCDWDRRISCPVCLCCSHLASGALFPLSLYLTVIDPGVMVLLRSLESWIFREMSLSVGAMLDSTVDTCSASVLWWLRTYFTHFLRCGGLESSVSERRSVPSRRFWLQSCSAQFALGHLEVLFTSFTWLRCVIRDSIFGSTCVSHRCRGAGSTRESDSGSASTHANLVVMLCRHRDRISLCRVKNNNNNPIWGGSVFTGEVPPLHSGELNHVPLFGRWPNPIPAIPPYVVRTPHLHGAPTTAETVEL